LGVGGHAAVKVTQNRVKTKGSSADQNSPELGHIAPRTSSRDRIRENDAKNNLNVFHQNKMGLPKTLAHILTTFLNTAGVLMAKLEAMRRIFGP